MRLTIALVAFMIFAPSAFTGEYKITFYDSCKKCCNKTDGITASGRPAKTGTIAVDRKHIPLGSKVWIEGIGECFADDVGGAIKGNRIDVWVSSHEEALRRGVVYRDVKILKSGRRIKQN